MRTEEGVRIFWETSLAWKGIPGYTEGVTIQALFKRLEPLYTHRSLPLAKQADTLGNEIVKYKRNRCRKPRKMPQNVVTLPVRQKKAAAA